jgi:hypothetical protein
MSLLDLVFGQKHIVLSDLYFAISTAYAKLGECNEALEFAGHSLLIRVKALGVMHDKNAGVCWLVVVCEGEGERKVIGTKVKGKLEEGERKVKGR